MRYFDSRIIAKSTPKNWCKEESGLKNNTVREVSSSEKITLENFWSNKGEYIYQTKYISLENTKTGETFEREILDITFFNCYEDDIKGKEKELVHVYVISFRDAPRLEETVVDDGMRDEKADAGRYMFGMDCGIEGDKSGLVIARQHRNGSIEILDTKTF